MKGNYQADDGFVVIENEFNRVVCGSERNDATFSYLRIDARNTAGDWEEILYWDEAEWHDRHTEAFEAIMGCIAKIADGEFVRKP